MSKQTIIVISERQRALAADLLARLPLGHRVEFFEPKRTAAQNPRMWSMLTDLAQQVTWHGLKLSPEDWKDIMSAGLKRELRVVPNITGDGFVQLGRSTSNMSVKEMTALMDLIEAFGVQQGVTFQVHSVRFDEHGQEVAA